MADWAYGLSGTVVGWFVGLLQAGAAQDREKVLRYRAVGRALRAEVHRIMSEMGDREGGSFFASIYGHTARVPQVEEWLKTLTTEAAAADPRVLTLFLELGRELHNFQTFETTLEKHREKAEEDLVRLGLARESESKRRRGELPDLELSAALPSSTISELGDDLSELDIATMDRAFEQAFAQMELESAARMLTDRIEDMEAMQESGRARIWIKLDVLEIHLTTLADLRVPSLLTFTLSRIPPFLPEYPPPDWVHYARGEIPARVQPAEELVFAKAAYETKRRRDEHVLRRARRASQS